MKVGIIGSGTWGTALSQVLADNGVDVLICGNQLSQIDDINNNHKNSFYFGDKIILPHTIKATANIEEVIKDREIIILSVPTYALRSVLEQIKPLLGDTKRIFINTAKGFELDTQKTMSMLIREVIPQKNRFEVVSLIGPSHAEEVIVRDLTCICAVCKEDIIAKTVADLFSNNYFRVYTNNDEIGAEIGVAMKNAIALSSGILEGLGYGDNARAALCTRGLAEIVRYGVSKGGKLETYLGLTGLGDLIVTCYSFHSRNFQAGLEIGKANSAKEFLANNKKTVEGINTVKTMYYLGQKDKIELPIINCLYMILFQDRKPSEVARYLMSRPIKKEKN